MKVSPSLLSADFGNLERDIDMINRSSADMLHLDVMDGVFVPNISLGVYNVTGRKNPYSVFFRTNGLGEVKGYMLSVFATQIPYINLNILF